MEYNIFLQISSLLAVTVAVAFFIRLLKQPLLVAYMIAGIICGPLFLNLLQGGENFYKAFANFGVVLLLFIVGLELNFSYLKRIGRVSISIGLLQFLINFLLTFPLALYFGLSVAGAVFLAVAACFSSTIVVLKLLSEKQDEESVYGRYSVGLMLVQDIISIIILLALSLIGEGKTTAIDIDLILRAFLVIVLVIISAKLILPIVLPRIATSGEFLFIFTVTWCFAVASLMMWSGFSLEIGAIIAGISLGSSRYHLEIASRIKPLRDFFLVLFFVILGSQANFSDWNNVLRPALILAGFVLIVKPILLYGLFRCFCFTRRNGFLGAVTAAQLSEFGFIILFAAVSTGFLSGQEISIFTAAAVITIFVSSYLIVYNYRIYDFFLPLFLLFSRDKYQQPEDTKEKFDAIIFGYDRTGWKVGAAFKSQKIKFAVVDFNPETVALLEKKGIRVFFGDAGDIEFLNALPLDTIKLLVCTVPSPEDQAILFEHVRARNKRAVIIANLHHKKYLDRVYKAGADYALLPHLLSGSWMAEAIIQNSSLRRSYWRTMRKQQTADLVND